MKQGAASIKLTMERPPKRLVAGFQDLPTTTLAHFLTVDSVIRHVIRPLWTPMPRVAGPAYTVRTVKHDSLMLHAAIYHAEPGDVIVVQAGDDRMAVADGNVCAVAQRRGVAGFVVDGVIRDVAESRGRGFPVFARGVSPIPGRQDGPGEIGGPITCGGVRVNPGDVVVADEEGIVVVPRTRAETVLKNARARAAHGRGGEPAGVGAQAPRAGGEHPARARLSRLEPDPAGHHPGHEDHHHHERQLDVVEGVEARRPRRVHRQPAAELDAPANEGDHRPDLEQEDQEEEAHLDPEERRPEVELGALLEPAEGAEQPGDDPEHRGDAPDIVGGQQAAQPVGVERTLERAAPQEHRGQPDGQGEQVQGRDDRGDHAGRVLLAAEELPDAGRDPVGVEAVLGVEALGVAGLAEGRHPDPLHRRGHHLAEQLRRPRRRDRRGSL